MKNIDEFIKESVGAFDLSKSLKTKGIKLVLEADDDDGGDDFGFDDEGGDDEGGDDFGFGEEGGDDAGADAGGDAGTDGGAAEGGSGDGADGASAAPNLDDYEEDPDFTKGIEGDSVTLNAVPAGETVYDSEGVMKSIKAVMETTPEDKLVEIEKVKNALEIIFNGKKLKSEDLDFENLKNAIWLIAKIQEPLDVRTKNYMNIKLKQPIMADRDKEKVALANAKRSLKTKRDTILQIDKLNNVKNKEQREAEAEKPKVQQ